MSFAAAYAYAPTRTPSVSLTAAAAPRPAVAPSARPPIRPTSGAYATQAARYRDAELAAATPGQLVVMLLDKCLLTVRRAETAFAAGDVAGRVEHVCRAADMVTELRASLDFAVGGDISTQLDALYAFVLGELFGANRDRSAGRLAPALRVLTGLRDGFAGAQAQLAAGATATAGQGGAT
jgi:flagellar protein FliS